MRSGVGAICPRCRPPTFFFAPRLPDLLFALALVPPTLLLPALLLEVTLARPAPAFLEVGCADLAAVPPFALVCLPAVTLDTVLVLPPCAAFVPLLLFCVVAVPNADGPHTTPNPIIASAIKAGRSVLRVIISKRKSSSTKGCEESPLFSGKSLAVRPQFYFWLSAGTMPGRNTVSTRSLS